MIYIRKIRPLSELHHAVCGTFTAIALALQRVQGVVIGPRRVGALDPASQEGTAGCGCPGPTPSTPVKSLFPSSLLLPVTRDEGSGSRGPGYGRDFHSLLVILSAQISLEAHI